MNRLQTAQVAARIATVLKRFDALSKDATSVADLAGDSKALLRETGRQREARPRNARHDVGQRHCQ